VCQGEKKKKKGDTCGAGEFVFTQEDHLQVDTVPTGQHPRTGEGWNTMGNNEFERCRDSSLNHGNDSCGGNGRAKRLQTKKKAKIFEESRISGKILQGFEGKKGELRPPRPHQKKEMGGGTLSRNTRVPAKGPHRRKGQKICLKESSKKRDNSIGTIKKKKIKWGTMLLHGW